MQNNSIIFKALYLSDNQLSRVPSAVGRLKKLRVLALRDNQLLSISKEIGQLEALKELHLQGLKEPMNIMYGRNP